MNDYKFAIFVQHAILIRTDNGQIVSVDLYSEYRNELVTVPDKN